MGNLEKQVIATVTSAEFVPGTLVLIHSFLRHNSWFKGDIVIICEPLEPAQKQLFEIFPNVIFQKPGDELLLQIGHLCRDLPKLVPKRRRFYSIEAFNLEGYQKMLFFDSDMLITGDLSEVVDLHQDLLACSDNPYDKTDRIRDRISFKRLPMTVTAEPSQILAQTFNAGFMVVGKKFLNTSTYQSLKDLISLDVFSKIRTHNTDQVVLNLFFDGMVTFLPPGYNLILSQSPELIQNDKIAGSEIKILHFTGQYKPWETSAKMDELKVDPCFNSFFNEWHQAYKEVFKLSKA